MANLVEWIEEITGDETIEAVVIGDMGWGRDFNSEHIVDFSKQPRNKVITWDEAKKWLNYDFDAGYGAPSCNAIWVWTTSKVIGIDQYDGSTSPFTVPRNPTDGSPSMPGG